MLSSKQFSLLAVSNFTVTWMLHLVIVGSNSNIIRRHRNAEIQHILSKWDREQIKESGTSN